MPASEEIVLHDGFEGKTVNAPYGIPFYITREQVPFDPYSTFKQLPDLPGLEIPVMDTRWVWTGVRDEHGRRIFTPEWMMDPR